MLKIQNSFEVLLVGPKDYGYELNSKFFIKSSREITTTKKCTEYGTPNLFSLQVQVKCRKHMQFYIYFVRMNK